MIALIDSDILCHEIGAVGQYKEQTLFGEVETIRNWSFVERTLDEKIEAIRKAVNADKVILFLTCGKTAYDQLIKIKDLPEYKPNFRFEVAKTKPYKGTRQNPKPYHYWNIYYYLISAYETHLSIGCEADDSMASYQHRELPSSNSTVICSRDKDLRMVGGWHYTWACGKQKEIPLYYVDPDEYGHIELVVNDSYKKIEGYGLKFFHSQMLTGDATDNIPGLPRVGPVKAIEALSEANSMVEGLSIVQSMYEGKIGDDWIRYFWEQANLLWMCTEYDDRGTVTYQEWCKNNIRRHYGGGNQ